MKHLLLTLGHNSSAILIENGELVWGYETERMTNTKSDSQFPKPVLDYVGSVKPDMVYVTHWSPDGKLSSMKPKHWRPDLLNGIPIRTHSIDRSHHDTHMHAALCYAGPKFPRTKRTYGLVVDGFGTFGEHFSVYDLSGAAPNLIRRVHGYGTSLGLWYQYATAFMGMKMHEDEYKLLGYEVHVDEDDARQIDLDSSIKADEWLSDMSKSVYGSKFDPMYNLDALEGIRSSIFTHLQGVCKQYNIEDPTSHGARVILSHYVQSVLEKVVLSVLDDLNPTNVLLSGGVFYNVKLNKRIVDLVEGKVCVYPLAGDQGNSIGLYYMDHPEFEFPKTLNWGKRHLKSHGHVEGLYVVDETTAYEAVRSTLKHYGYVNLVRGPMEFGPRAMCNTSTLAMPSPYWVSAINAMNDRNTVMPMAPAMTRNMYENMFERTERVWKSEAHMILALEYKEHPEDLMLGIAHEYHHPHHHHTGRPQVVNQSDWFMTKLLNEVGHPVINTSFNFHGRPIAMGMESIISNHMMQYKCNSLIQTVVIKNA